MDDLLHAGWSGLGDRRSILLDPKLNGWRLFQANIRTQFGSA